MEPLTIRDEHLYSFSYKTKKGKTWKKARIVSGFGYFKRTVKGEEKRLKYKKVYIQTQKKREFFDRIRIDGKVIVKYRGKKLLIGKVLQRVPIDKANPVLQFILKIKQWIIKEGRNEARNFVLPDEKHLLRKELLKQPITNKFLKAFTDSKVLDELAGVQQGGGYVIDYQKNFGTGQIWGKFSDKKKVLDLWLVVLRLDPPKSEIIKPVIVLIHRKMGLDLFINSMNEVKRRVGIKGKFNVSNRGLLIGKTRDLFNTFILEYGLRKISKKTGRFLGESEAIYDVSVNFVLGLAGWRFEKK